MKRFSRYLTVVLCLLMCLLFASTVHAADEPSPVTNAKYKKLSETSVQLSWTKAKKATGYTIYRVNTATGQKTRVGSTSKTYYTIKKLVPGKTYTYQIYSYRKVKKNTVYSTAGSPVVYVKTSVSVPKTPSNFRMTARGNETATLRWSGVSNASGYVVYSVDSSGKETAVRTIKNKNTKLCTLKTKDGESYKFFIKSYRTVNGITTWSKASKIVTVTGKAFNSKVQSVHSAYFNVKTKRSVTVTTSEGKKITSSKGTRFYVTSRPKTRSNVTGYIKGQKITISSSAISYTSLNISPKSDYSTSTKEAFINAKGYSSKTGWFIWISQHTLKVNVFKGSQGNWKLMRTYPCCIGSMNNRTTLGLHRILTKRAYGKYGGPVIHFTKGGGTNAAPAGCAFHNLVDSNISKAVSHGCVRMRTDGLNYIYQHCPVGTTVLSY